MRPLIGLLLSLALRAQDLAMPAPASPPHHPEDPREREEYFLEARRTADGLVGGPQRLAAIADLDRIRRSPLPKSPAGRRHADLRWKLIGPQPAGGINAGRVPAMAVDPRDPEVVYIGPADGGVWKTTNGGQTWTPLTDDQPTLAIGAIALDPENPNIVYVGTGEQSFSGDSYYGAGILKSTDGGATWVNHVGPFLRTFIGGLAIHPRLTRILLASASRGGVWRSTDDGENWTNTLTGGISSDVRFSPDGSVAYATLQNAAARNGVWRSTDAGLTWTRINGTAPDNIPDADTGRIELAISPSQPNILFAAVASTETARNGSFLGLYKTVDGGTRWSRLNVVDFCTPQCWYDLVVAVHPTDPDNVWVGGLRVFRSLDGGRNFVSAGTNYHVDQHQFVFTKNGDRLYIGNDGGVWSTISITTTPINWFNHNATLAITQFYPGISIHPTDPNIGLGGTQDNSTQRYSGRLAWDMLTCGDGGWTAIDPARPANLFSTCQNIDLRRSAEGVNGTFQIISGLDQSDRKRFIPPFIMDPTDGKRLYFGTMRVYQSRDGGGSWRPISPDITGNSTVSTFAVAPADASIMLAGTTNGRVYVGSNILSPSPQWRQVNGPTLPTRFVSQARIHPVDSRVMYLVYGGFAADNEAVKGHVFRSSDGGLTWSDISGNLPNIPVNDLAIDPDLANTLYLATDAGVMFSSDNGATWADLGIGLPRSVALALNLHRHTRTLRVATHGRSMWDFELGPVEGRRRPVISALEPARAAAGAAAFTLTIRGEGFAPGATVRWNGVERVPPAGTATELQVRVNAEDVARLGRADIAVFNPVASGGLSHPVEFPIGDAPATREDAIVSAAFPTGGAELVPGSLATLFGTNLAPEALLSPLPLSRTLGGFSFVISTTLTPLVFVSPGQVNFQVPWFGITAPTNTTARLIQNGRTFDTRVRLVTHKPAIFTSNQAGTGQGLITIAGTGLVAAPAGAIGNSRPVRRGEFLEIYATGLGPVRNTPLTGEPASATTLSPTVTEATVSIGGASARVLYAGLAPGFIGLYQVNVELPAGAATGASVPVTVTIGGVTSNSVTIAVE